MERLNSLRLIESSQLSSSVFNNQNIAFRGKPIKLQSNPIFRCNYFLLCYNSLHKKPSGIELKKLPRSKIYNFCYPVLGIKYLLLQLILDFIPYINIL